jgi:hypothetical protein
MQIGQAYELWSEQESGGKQKSLTKKAIEAYKQAKTPAAKEHITELQERASLVRGDSERVFPSAAGVE